MGSVQDLTSIRTTRILTTSVVRACELSYAIPQCVLVREFLEREKLSWHAFYMPLVMTRPQRQKLGVALKELHDKVVSEQARLCAAYGVTTPDDIPSNRRMLFDAALRVFIEKEDHFKDK